MVEILWFLSFYHFSLFALGVYTWTMEEGEQEVLYINKWRIVIIENNAKKYKIKMQKTRFNSSSPFPPQRRNVSRHLHLDSPLFEFLWQQRSSSSILIFNFVVKILVMRYKILIALQVVTIEIKSRRCWRWRRRKAVSSRAREI